MEDMDTSDPTSDDDYGEDGHSYDNLVNGVGFMAGLFVSVALLPQIRRVYRRKSATDLSIFWQGTVAVGLTMQLFFLRYNRMWSVFIPVLGELVLVLILAGLKLYFDGVEGPQKDPPTEDALASLNCGPGGDGEMFVGGQPEEGSGEGALLFAGSDAQFLEPLLVGNEEDQRRPDEGGGPDKER